MVRIFVGEKLKVGISKEGTRLVFRFSLEEGDRENPTNNFSIGVKTVKVELGEFEIDNIHPDLIALSSVLICHPFVGKELEFPMEVSEEFSMNINRVVSRYDFIAPSHSIIQKRRTPENFRMGLAFSGGVDSTAALSILPPDTVPVFMLRPEKGKSLYNPRAALKSCKFLSEIGYDIRIVECDVEYVRDPVGFPTDLAHAIPAILLADELSIDALSFGTVLESAFGIGHESFRNYFTGSHNRFYGSLLKSVGIELSLPVSGISEVGTSIIVNSGPLGQFSQSCIRGEWGKPCKRCWKCCRKGLLDSALSSNLMANKEIDWMFSSEEVRRKISSIPISHENVIEYSLQRLKTGNHEVINSLGNRVNRGSNLEYLERWYSPSIDLVPEKYRRGVRERILSFIDLMGEEEEGEIIGWDMTEFIQSRFVIESTSKLKEVLS